MGRRYAVYHVPDPASELHRLGRLVLGRGLYDPPSGSLASRAAAYGFHATIVAPFFTVESPTAMLETLSDEASSLVPLSLGRLVLTTLPPGFPALVPDFAPPGLWDLESRLVKAMSRHRRPPTAGEVARRGVLTARQTELFKKWGYPFVLDEFRYHLTLGDPAIDPAEREFKIFELSELFDRSVLEGPLILDKLTLCLQESSDSPFVAVADVPLGVKSLARPVLLPARRYEFEHPGGRLGGI